MLEVKDIRNFIQQTKLFGAAEQVMAEQAIRVAQRESAELYLAMLLTIKALLKQHVCIRLPEQSGHLLQDPESNRTLILPEYTCWRSELKKCAPAVAVLESDQQNLLPESMLVVDKDGGCYLQRQWSFELSIKKALLDRASVNRPLPDWEDNTLTKLCKLFKPKKEHPATDYQQLAVAAALQKKLLILSGGPGTGKTTVAAAILAAKLLLQPDLKIALAAPTAKAANRLLESLQENLDNLQINSGVRQSMDSLQCSTLHRLLGVRSRSHEFKHNFQTQLDCDLLLIDECSMVPQDLMARTLEALPEKADLLLLGDRYQLSSVEAGSVMADLCDSARSNQVNTALAEFFHRQTGWLLAPATADEIAGTPLSGTVIELTENHRFAEKSKLLGEIAGAIRQINSSTDCRSLAAEIASRQGDEFAMQQLENEKISFFIAQEFKKIRNISGNTPPLELAFCQIPQLAASGKEDNWQLAFKLLATLKLLAPGYQGPRGLEQLNNICMRLLNLNEVGDVGTALQITRNDYRLNLFNGDIGLVVKDPQSEEKVVVFQEHPKRRFKLVELPEYEVAFAISVHKSQGSGFDDVIFIMPEKSGELCTREMVYTAMTRAKKRLICIGSSQTLSEALANPTCRISNLAGKLRNVPAADNMPD
ncbi:MAG: exodeoxyribonuclease V subunit alpha [Lentisphaerae bacterium]|nr:exodeoxyribonuclease V subunit alpha [Lentisphaerota bacterium]